LTWAAVAIAGVTDKTVVALLVVEAVVARPDR